MTTYNAKDLIEQAAMLADLQNSDFISWKENMMFLDNAWADLYQQIINHGDKTFIKTLTFTGNRVELPDDFYQLNYVCYSSGFNRIPINRKAKTASSNGPFYDLIGNELVIYNKLNSMQTIEVDYFPTRDSITFAADEQESPVLADYDYTHSYIVDVCDSKVLVLDETTPSSKQYSIIDIITGDRYQKSTHGDTFLYLQKSRVDDGVVMTSNPEYPIIKKDFNAFEGYISDNNYIIRKLNTSNGVQTTYKEITNVTVFPQCSYASVSAMTDDGIYWTQNGDLMFWDFETKETTRIAQEIINPNVYSYNNVVYYETREGVWADNQLILKSEEYGTYNGVMKADLKTGYGILVDNYIIKSAFPNTELDYPNNFYFNYLAYKLAVYYKIKQNQDTGGLLALANDALKTFYDSLPKDENEYVRISNVYAR